MMGANAIETQEEEIGHYRNCGKPTACLLNPTQTCHTCVIGPGAGTPLLGCGHIFIGVQKDGV